MEFYIMKKTQSNFANAYADRNERDEEMICPNCNATRYEKRRKKFNVYFKGKKQGDYYSAIICKIVSLRLLEELQKENVTGFEVRDIVCTKWLDQRGNLINNDAGQYKEIFITGRTGFLKHRDGIEVKRRCEVCGATEIKGERGMSNVNGLMVDEKEWDGSEMFYFKNWPGNLIVTERVKEIIEKGKFKNIEFCNIKEYQSNI